MYKIYRNLLFFSCVVWNQYGNYDANQSINQRTDEEKRNEYFFKKMIFYSLLYFDSIYGGHVLRYQHKKKRENEISFFNESF